LTSIIVATAAAEHGNNSISLAEAATARGEEKGKRREGEGRGIVSFAALDLIYV